MNTQNEFNKMIKIVTILGALAVILGAFGAHSLKAMISEQRLLAYQTGISYQFYHLIAMLGIAILYKQGSGQNRFRRAFYLLLAGIVFFSGSLYLLAIQEVININLSFLGPVTPIGGLLFIAGWVYLFIGANQKSSIS